MKGQCATEDQSWENTNKLSKMGVQYDYSVWCMFRMRNDCYKRLHWPIIIIRLCSYFQIAVFVKKQLNDEQKYIEEGQNEDLNY